MVPPTLMNAWKTPLLSGKSPAKSPVSFIPSTSVLVAPGTSYSVKVPLDRKYACSLPSLPKKLPQTVPELLMPRPSVKPKASLGSTIGALKLPSLNRTKPREKGGAEEGGGNCQRCHLCR